MNPDRSGSDSPVDDVKFRHTNTTTRYEHDSLLRVALVVFVLFVQRMSMLCELRIYPEIKAVNEIIRSTRECAPQRK